MLLGVALLLAIAAYSIWWRLTAHTLQNRIDAWIAKQRAAGVLVAPDQFTIGGYPLAFSVSADGVSLKWPKGFAVGSQHLEIAAHPWSPLRFRIAATHGFSFALPPGAERPAYAIAGETLRGRVMFGDGSMPKDLQLTAETVSAAEEGGQTNGGEEKPEALIATLEIASFRPDVPPVKDTDVGLDLSIHAIDLTTPALKGHPLGSTIADTAFKAEILGPLPASAEGSALKSWRDAGGNVEVTDLELRWGPLTLSAKGTAALDNEMQPEGAFTAHLVGWDKTIDALAAAGWIKLGPASLAKLALGVASQPDANGQAAVDTPVTIQSRRISVGPMKLGQIPELKLD